MGWPSGRRALGSARSAYAGRVLQMFRGRDLMKIGRRLDRTTRERAGEAAAATDAQRADAVEQESRRLRELLRRKKSG